jgi:hypothetical protein
MVVLGLCSQCTYVNLPGATSCAMCDEPVWALGQCSQCTYLNLPGATSCAMCDEPVWTCAACTRSAAEIEKDHEVVLVMSLQCMHPACVVCHRQHIRAQDEVGRDPFCLTCSNPLDDASVKAILGEEAHSIRAERLVQRVGRLVDCPTPDCGARFELEHGLWTRRTTCKRCMRTVELVDPRAPPPLPPPRIPHAAAAAAAAAASPAPPVPPHATSSSASSGAADNPVLLYGTDSEEENETLRERIKRRKMEPQGAVSAAVTAAAAATSAAVTASSFSLSTSSLSSSAASSLSAAAPDPDASVPEGAALGSVRACPKCGNGVCKENDEQCDKIECRCGCKFCFHCCKPYKLSGGAWRAPCRCNIERYGPGHSFPRPPTP